MCWAYTGSQRIKRGNRYLVPASDLCKLPNEVLKQAKKNKVIKFIKPKKNGKNEEGGTDSEGAKKAATKKGGCGCKEFNEG